MSQATLEQLPQELIEMIASNLLSPPNGRPGQYTRGFAELLSFRLACRQISSYVQHFFIHKVLLAEEWRYRNLSVGTDITSLNDFDALAKLDPIPTAIETIRFQDRTVDEYGLRLCAGRCLGCDKMFLDFERVNLEGMELKDILKSPEASMTLHVNYQDLLYEQEWMMATQDYGTLVNGIFSRGFTKLEEVCIGGSNDIILKDLYDYEYYHSHSFPFNGKMERSLRLLTHVETSQHEQVTRATAATIRALSENNVEVKKFLVTQTSGYPLLRTAGIWVLDQPLQILQAFHVRKLYLQLSNRTTAPAPPDWTSSRGHDILIRALDALPNLEGLSLAPSRNEIFNRDFTKRILQRCPPSVKKFFLHDFVVERQALSDFIDQRKSTLCTLGITKAHLLKEEWMPLIRKLRDETKFAKLYIGFLYELSAESYHMVQFPALARNRMGDPDTVGSYEYGKWRAGRKGHGLFLQLSNSDPRDEHKVQAGLSHMVSNGFRTKHDRSDRLQLPHRSTREKWVARKHEAFAKSFFGATPFRRWLASGKR